MVTIRPHLETKVGKKNLYNFLETNNVAHFHITIPYEVIGDLISEVLFIKVLHIMDVNWNAHWSNKAGVRYEYWTDNIWRM